MSKQRLSRESYKVGWICPLEVEQVAALQMLDEEHERLPQPRGDTNIYNLGSINGHNVVIAGLPRAGNCPAATVVTQMRMTYPNLKFGLLVGIGGGVPRKTESGMIRLGHVVVSEPTGVHSGAVQYDHGRARTGHFERTGFLAPPPTALLNATREIAVRRQLIDDDPIWGNLKRIDTSRRALRRFEFPGSINDYLYPSDYTHKKDGASCQDCGCDINQRIKRPVDDDEEEVSFIVVHRGTIASGEMVIKDAQKRDQLAQEHGVLCFEMEAVGALSDFPCLVVRGISDYCDTHKNDIWHGYAAGVAAAYARQLFFYMAIEESKVSFSADIKTRPDALEINKSPSPIQTGAFLRAVKDGQIKDIESWLEIVDVNARDPRSGRTALSFAAEAGKIDVAKTLLEHHASVNVRQYSRPGDKSHVGPAWTNGRSELSWAVDRGHAEMTELLLRHGAHPNSRNTVGQSALHYACMRDDRRIARNLLEKGADVNCSHNGWRPVHEALFRNHFNLLRMILEYQPLLDVNAESGANGKAPLHFAVVKKNSEILKLLLRKRACPDIRMVEGITPLHLAAARGWIEGIRILAESNALIDSKDSLLLETPLHKAARNCNSEACRVLIQYGANPKERNIDGQDYESILESAQQYPDDWKVDPGKVSYLT
ncbi:uncharacterized protein N7477_000940 [Penicillium maclennaniae]|uniref:uncharacterized protein n=1 Tax=Penicillium maclennaniae TaxID=1343394 RepID=UPI002541A8BE|nr:uncharacterized protein N7477_000940 [Penicillium maclennaniae]KAJ5684595.1 hypothetical protein N7477_000940 [Penicillium maclennaniae]